MYDGNCGGHAWTPLPSGETSGLPICSNPCQTAVGGTLSPFELATHAIGQCHRVVGLYIHLVTMPREY